MSRFVNAVSHDLKAQRAVEALSRRHRPAVEVGLVVFTYLLYDSSRGLFGGGRAVALIHARQVVRLERWASLNIEKQLQSVARSVPALDKAFSLGYVTLHLGATITALLWLYRKIDSHPYERFRTSLVVASFMSLVCFALFPTAPPRLAGIGVADTVTRGTVNLNSSSLHWLYNPFAALPSIHIAYAVLVGLSLLSYGRRPAVKATGLIYPLWVACEVIATGNHFVLDVLAGAFVAAASWWLAHYVALTSAAPVRRVVIAPVEDFDEPAAAA